MRRQVHDVYIRRIRREHNTAVVGLPAEVLRIIDAHAGDMIVIQAAPGEQFFVVTKFNAEDYYVRTGRKIKDGRNIQRKIRGKGRKK